MIVQQALTWLGDPSNEIPARFWEHVWITLLAVAIACVVAVPIGFLIGHTGRARSLAVAISGGVRALPTLGVLTLVGLAFGIGLIPPLIALVVLAIPSVLAGAYTGVESADRSAVDAARAMGMTEWQVLWSVEIPLGLPLLVGGVRAAVLQVVATATLAAYVGAGGLGGFLFAGLKLQDYGEMLGASLVVIALAIAFEIVFVVLERAVAPAGSSVRRVRTRRTVSAASSSSFPKGTLS